MLSLQARPFDAPRVTAPDTTAVPREPAVLYALVGALVERCRADAGPVANFVRYATRMPDEFGLLALCPKCGIGSESYQSDRHEHSESQ